MGIIDDFVNRDIAHYTIEQLYGTALQPYVARHPDPYAALGVSGRPVPPVVWDIGIDDYAPDINVRASLCQLAGLGSRRLDPQQRRGRTGTETWPTS